MITNDVLREGRILALEVFFELFFSPELWTHKPPEICFYIKTLWQNHFHTICLSSSLNVILAAGAVGSLGIFLTWTWRLLQLKYFLTGSAMRALLERTRTRSSPPRRSLPSTPCALRRRCATPAATRTLRASLLALAEGLQQRRGRASPRCPPKDAWKPARGRRCGWGVLQRLYTSSVTTCPRTTAREANPWPRYKPSNTPSSTSTSFQISWAVRNGRKTDHFTHQVYSPLDIWWRSFCISDEQCNIFTLT